MKITISVEWLFFIIPFLIAYLGSLSHDDHSSYLGSDRGWYWIFIGPLTLVVSLGTWALYLKWVK